MSNNKSINELLSSIVNLINEAKNEYEFVINKGLPKRVFSETEIVGKEDTTENKKKSNTISLAEINTFDKKQVKKFNNWQHINFEKTVKKAYFKNFSSNLTGPNNKKIEVEFRSLLNSWLKRNLNKLIELEISNYIKNRQN
tara:strand:- start:289 stop:711 length:423 start_codon:yes stop_codon:yes gene_type:complete